MPELYYKYILGTLVILSGIIRFVYEIRYARIEKTISYKPRREKVFGLLFGACFMLPGLLYLFTDLLNFASFNVAGILRILAAAVMLLNVVFFLRIHITLGRNWSPVLELSPEQTLITSGPYKYIRHPMYASFFIHSAASWILSANHFVGASGFIAFAIIYFFRVKTEEQMMIDRFGDKYLEYMKRTGRLFPKFFT